MNISLIICTYKRPEATVKLLESVCFQIYKPFEVLVIDGSPDNLTESAIISGEISSELSNLKYFLVPEEHRGLTRQRNYGISRISSDSQIVAFLDDDTILEQDYFFNLRETFLSHGDAVGVGGYITNEVNWTEKKIEKKRLNEFEIDGWVRKDDIRIVARKILGLSSNTPPGIMPAFSHGRSVSSLPPSGKVYEVEYFMGGVAAYKKEIFEKVKFSEYFEGYGLYEDLDFCLRAGKLGKMYVNTNARLAHYHEAAGRPNKFKYGKMVVRNGWYVWRVKNVNPTLEGKIKWNLITLLLAGFRLINGITGPRRKEALTEALGRFAGFFELFFIKPQIKR